MGCLAYLISPEQGVGTKRSREFLNLTSSSTTQHTNDRSKRAVRKQAQHPACCIKRAYTRKSKATNHFTLLKGVDQLPMAAPALATPPAMLYPSSSAPRCKCICICKAIAMQSNPNNTSRDGDPSLPFLPPASTARRGESPDIQWLDHLCFTKMRDTRRVCPRSYLIRGSLLERKRDMHAVQGTGSYPSAHLTFSYTLPKKYVVSARHKSMGSYGYI
jgi:hypothetical protein